MYITDLYEDNLEISIKVVIVGNGAVGKSSLIQRYCRGIFTNNYKKTIGVDFLEKHLRISSEDVRLMLWDTAGQEEFDAITKAYYRGAQACVVAFSTTDRASFDAVRKWKRKVEDECGHVPMVLVQNKMDLMHESKVSVQEVEDLANELQMRLHRTSVKDDLNVEGVFAELAENYVAKVKALEALADLAMPGPTLTSSATANMPMTHIGGVGANSRLYQEPYVPSLLLMQNNYKNNRENSKNFVRKIQVGGNPSRGQHQHLLNNKQQQHNSSRQQQQQQQHNSVFLGYNSHHNPIMISKPGSSTGMHSSSSSNSNTGSSSFQQKFLRKSNNNSFGNSNCHFSPTDYLNNPMFDTLHNRRYWPGAGGRDSGTITLRPLGNLAKKNVHRKLPLVNKNSCKVL